MVTMVTMSKWLSFSVFCSSQIPLAHLPEDVRINLTFLLIPIEGKQLLNCPILPKNGLIFNVGLLRY